MALTTLTLPKCDVCGEVTLPSPKAVFKGIRAREDIRAYDEARRAGGKPRYRCGKCKSPNWDREYTGDRRRKDPHGASAAQQTRKESSPPSKSKSVPNGGGLKDLYGILADTYKELGGGEANLREERNWGPDVWERHEKQLQEEARKEDRK